MISLNDIIIKPCEKDNTKYYNIGDRLNMPFYWKESYSFSDVEQKQHSLYYPNSILYKYYQCHRIGEHTPNLKKLQDCVNEYSSPENRFTAILNKIRQNTTLVIHIRSGDYGSMTVDYYNTIVYLSKNFKNIILFCGVHNNNRHTQIDTAKQRVCDAINKVLGTVINTEVYLDDPDAHLYLMSQATNLLIHKGGFSLLGSFVTSGTIYYTKELQAWNNDKWHNAIKHKHTVFIDSKSISPEKLTA